MLTIKNDWERLATQQGFLLLCPLSSGEVESLNFIKALPVYFEI